MQLHGLSSEWSFGAGADVQAWACAPRPSRVLRGARRWAPIRQLPLLPRRPSALPRPDQALLTP